MKNNKKILLISNFENTEIYHTIFDKSFGNNIYWYVVNKKKYEFLKKFYLTENLIYLNKKNFPNFNTEENNLEDIKLNELLWSDRVLKINQQNQDYLKTIANYIYKFLKKNQINIIFGEFTWSYEIVISRVAKILNIPYYNMQSVRYPSNRFLFFSNEKQNLFFIRNKPQTRISVNEEDNKYEKYIIEKTKNINNLKYIFIKAFKLFTNDYFDRNDPTYTSKYLRTTNFILKLINKFTYFIIPKIDKKKLKQKNYIIYYLQKNPEATVDIKGMYYSDQINNIINIWKILPKNFQLIIKEHPNCIGDRNIFFYKKLLKLKNVFLIKNEDLKDNEKFVINSYATFSIASTASLQSAYKKIPSFTFGETFFNCLKYSIKLSLEDLRNSKNLESLIDTKIKEKNDDENFYLKNSFEGYLILDNLKDTNNLTKIKEAISEVIEC